MTDDWLFMSVIFGVGWAYSVIAGKLGWPETFNENTEEFVPHRQAARNCFAWSMFFLCLAAVTVCFPRTVPVMSAAGHLADRVYTFFFEAMAGLLILAMAVISLAVVWSSIYDSWINGNRAPLIVGLAVAALLLSLPFVILHPSAHAKGRVLVRLWQWLWHLG